VISLGWDRNFLKEIREKENERTSAAQGSVPTELKTLIGAGERGRCGVSSEPKFITQ